MRKMTCRSGLVWQARLAVAEQGRRARLVFVAAICLGLMVTSARGGDLNPPAGPTSSNSAMFTLNDIYNKLDTRATVSMRTNAFTEPSGGPTNGTMHTLNDIMTLVTNRAPVAKTGQTPTIPYANTPLGSDGNLQIGVVWPNPRFTTNNIAAAGTNVVTDKLTGLMWTRNATNNIGMKDWTNAISSCTNMNSGSGTYGYTDWRLPNVNELLSLIAWQYGSPALSDGTGTNQWTADLGPFTGVPASGFWSSTTCGGNSGYALYVTLYYGGGLNYDAKTSTYRVWPVRGGGN